MILSQLASPAVLGTYAVATTLTSLASPIVAGIGNVMLPRLASGSTDRAGSDDAIKRSIFGSVTVSVIVAISIAIAAPIAVPVLFGTAFRPAIPLVWLLSPGGVAIAVTVVAGDLLRGKGRPSDAARAQIIGAVVTVVLLAVLIPGLGAVGAAIASTVAAFVILVMMLKSLGTDLRREQARIGD